MLSDVAERDFFLQAPQPLMQSFGLLAVFLESKTAKFDECTVWKASQDPEGATAQLGLTRVEKIS